MVYVCLTSMGIGMNKNLSVKVTLSIIALLYTIFGVMFFVSPETYAPNLGFHNASEVALLEITAVYGGFEFISGLAIFTFTFKNQEKFAAYYSLITLGGFTFGRIVGILKYGFVGANLEFLILELTLTSLALFSLRKLK